MKHKGYKFAIKSPEQSEQLQNVLFKLGYGWAGHETFVQFKHKVYLFVEKSDNSITYSNDQWYFDNHDFKELYAEEVIASGKLNNKSKWNKVAGGMPPEANKCYLVYCEKDKCQYTASVNDVGQWESWNLEGISVVVKNPSAITHWREMPKGPKE